MRLVGRSRWWVGENVYFLAFDNNRFIVDALDLIPDENVITINESSLGVATVSSLKGRGGTRKIAVDAAIDMEFFARSSAVFTFLSGARRRVGLHRYAGGGAYRGDLMTHRLVYNPHLHTSQVFYTMVEALNRAPDTFPRLDPGGAATRPHFPYRTRFPASGDSGYRRQSSARQWAVKTSAARPSQHQLQRSSALAKVGNRKLCRTGPAPP